MEFFLFLLAGFLSLAEGQSEWRFLNDSHLSHLMLVTSIQLSFVEPE